jgi:phosphopantothenoylcysteine decarboxylase/phosphopantothenate--cysteine ligase
VRILDHARGMTLLGDDGLVRELDGDTAELARAVLEHVSGAPRTREEIVAHVAARAGAGTVEAAAIVDPLIAALAATGVITTTTRASFAPAPPGLRPRVLLAITGAIATLSTASLVTALLRRGLEVRIAATRSALRLIGAAGLEALTHQPVARSLWSRDPAAPVPHLELAAWADLVLVCPASASTIARLARGDCDELVAAIAASTRAPLVIVPSMNPAMREAPILRANLEALIARGALVAHDALAIEVAEAPGERRAIPGGAPPAEHVADLAVAALRAHPPAAAPLDARGWEALYANAREDDLSWYVAPLDDAFTAAFDRHVKTGALLLDLGTGPGTVAIEAARRGAHVVATDISPSALARAAARAADLPIAWMIDDVLASRLASRFAVITDRGCFHVLREDRLAAYVAAVARLAAAGATLILATDAPDADPSRHTRRLAPDAIAALFAPAFRLISSAPAKIAAAPALLTVLARTV